MTATMKGLLKGLRYISQIFDNSDEDEPEMQIGNPTDVKHVAHIGWDGPSVTSPSWMNDYKPSNESSSEPLNTPQTKKTGAAVPEALEISKPRHYSSLDVPSPEPEERKQTRRRHSAGGSINSPGRDAADGLKPKKHQHHHSSLEVDSSDPNYVPSPPAIPKKSRKKKSKESTAEGSSSKSRMKGNKAKSKDNDCPLSGVKSLSLDDTKGSDEEFPRQDLNL